MNSHRREVLAAAFELVHGRGVLHVWEGLSAQEDTILRLVGDACPGYSRSEILEAHGSVQALFDAALRLALRATTADLESSILELRRECKGFTDEQYRRSMSDAVTHQAF